MDKFDDNYYINETETQEVSKPNDAETDPSDDSIRKMLFELALELYEETKKFEDPDYLTNIKKIR